MLGFLVFSDSNQLLLVYADAPMRNHLIGKQSEFFHSEMSTSGCSDMNTSPEPSDSSNESKSNALYDLHALTQYFLPLNVLYQTKREFDSDPYKLIATGETQFHFTRLPNEFLLITLSDTTSYNRFQLDLFSHTFSQIIELSFGPLLYCIDDTTSSGKVGTFFNQNATKLFRKFISRTLADTRSWMENSAAAMLELSLVCQTDDGELHSAMDRLMEHFHVFLSASVCMLVRGHRLVTLRYAGHDVEGGEWLTADDLQMLVMAVAEKLAYHRPGVMRPKHIQIWLQYALEKPKRTLWNVFRMDLGSNYGFICVARADYAHVIALAEQMQSELTDLCEIGAQVSTAQYLRNCAHMVNSIDRLCADLCRKLYSYSLVESPNEKDTENRSSGSNAKADLATQLSSKWWTTRQHLNACLVASAANSSTETLNSQSTSMPILKPQVESRLRYLARMVQDLLTSCVDRSRAAAKRTQTPVFARCWKNIQKNKTRSVNLPTMLHSLSLSDPTSGFVTGTETESQAAWDTDYYPDYQSQVPCSSVMERSWTAATTTTASSSSRSGSSPERSLIYDYLLNNEIEISNFVILLKEKRVGLLHIRDDLIQRDQQLNVLYTHGPLSQYCKLVVLTTRRNSSKSSSLLKSSPDSRERRQLTVVLGRKKQLTTETGTLSRWFAKKRTTASQNKTDVPIPYITVVQFDDTTIDISQAVTQSQQLNIKMYELVTMSGSDYDNQTTALRKLHY